MKNTKQKTAIFVENQKGIRFEILGIGSGGKVLVFLRKDKTIGATIVDRNKKTADQGKYKIIFE